MAEVFQVNQIWEIMTFELHYFHLVAMGHGLQTRSLKKTQQHGLMWPQILTYQFCGIVPIFSIYYHLLFSWNQIFQHLQRISKNTEGIPHKSRITPRPFFGQCGLAASPFRLCWTLRMCLEEEYILYFLFVIMAIWINMIHMYHMS